MIRASQQRVLRLRALQCSIALVAVMGVVHSSDTNAQSLTGALIGTVKDQQGGAIVGAVVRMVSASLLGGSVTVTTNDKGQLRFPALSPGTYVLEIEYPGFTAYREEGIRVGMSATIERAVVLHVAAVAGSVIVEGRGSRMDARDPGFGTRFGPDDLQTIPTRRNSMFDFIRAAPGVSPTSPGSMTATTISTFGSAVNENNFLIDGTNFTCPCSGLARANPGIDFIQEIHVQSIGASAEFGNVQGGVINVVTRQGSERLLYDASYYAQPAGLTSQPVRSRIRDTISESGYERVRYRDFTTNVGGPLVRDRAWFFGGYQYLRDYDSQPGTDARFPRTSEQDKFFAKLTWRPAPAWQLVHSFHDEVWLNPVRATVAMPFEATTRNHGSVPAVTFGNLTHTLSANTFWDVRAGRFVYSEYAPPSSGSWLAPSRRDTLTGVTTGAPPTAFDLKIIRTTAKAMLTHYRPGASTDHEWKLGLQVERGEHRVSLVTPTGIRFIDNGGRPFQSVSRAPSRTGGLFLSMAAFATDTITIGDRLTLNLGVRFDHSRAISQELPAIDLQGRETDGIAAGSGTLYTWNIVSPRLGVTAKLTADGRTMLRASYGRFSAGMLTGEFEAIHRGQMPTTTRQYDPATADYTTLVSVIGNANFRLDAATRAPRTDEYSVGVDREIGRQLAVAAAYVRKTGANFIGWTDVGGQYREGTRTLSDGRVIPVFTLLNAPSDRRFLLTNPADYQLTYNGLVLAAEKRRSRGWQAFGSYTWSRAYGLLPSSGTTAAGPQVSSVGPPLGVPFGRDPNDLTNARGRLANDRPQMLRIMGSVDVPRTGLMVAANFQHFSGKPWAATTQIQLVEDRRILLEPRGTRRLPSQSLLDLRLFRTVAIPRIARIDLLLDVLNLLNDTAPEDLVTDNLFSPNFGMPSVFVDPRRVMLGVRLNLGR